MSSTPQFDERTSQTITLEDGRTLGFAEFGPKDGFPIFESAAFEHNARIITVDRPGVGISSPQPGRTALDHAKDIQSLANHLSISTFSIVGVSGGGPYALACAYAIPPSQLRSVALVAGCGVYNAETAKGMGAANRWMFWALKAAPWAADIFVRVFFGMMLWSSDEALHAKMKDSLGGGSWIMPPPDEKDKAALEDGEVHKVLVAEIREHFKQGFATYTEDGKILAGDLGFDIAGVQSDTVALWYGKRDANVPPGIGEDYAQRLKGKAKLRIEDETHIRYVAYIRCQSLHWTCLSLMLTLSQSREEL
jgi:pimeloyl-ACP methyl ester carboxylesterase